MRRLANVASAFLGLVRPGEGSRFRRNFLQVARANVLVQALALALAPLLTRLYTPADFGTAVLFTSLLNLLAAIGTARVEWSIPNAASPRQAAALLWLGLVPLAVTSVIGFFALAHFRGGVEFGAASGELARFAFFVPIALAGTGIQQLLQGWYTRANDLTAVSRAQVGQSIAGNCLSLGGGVIGAGAPGLVGSAALSAWVGVGTLWRHAPDLARDLSRQSRAELALAFRQFGGEALVSSAVSVASVASLAVVPFFLAGAYSPAEVGWYALMSRLALAPVQLFTNALGRSFWSEAAGLVRTDLPALRRLYLTTAVRLAAAAVPVGLVCAAGPLFVAPVFGAQWRDAGFILLALSPGVVAQLVVQPITHLIVHRKQHWKLYLDAAKLAAIVAGLIWLAGRRADLHLVAWWLSAVHVAGYAVLFWLNLRCLSNPTPTSR